jgi:hypothetical protein
MIGGGMQPRQLDHLLKLLRAGWNERVSPGVH